jgi:hypothetical protein
MSTKSNLIAITSKNLQYGGLAFLITAAYILYAKPENIVILLAPYSGDPVSLGSVMVFVGGLASILGYTLKKWLNCSETN